MLTVACVLRSGGEYTPEYVRVLHEGVATHLPEPFRFVCLTDIHEGWDYAGPLLFDTEPLLHDWPGWWAKLELFRPGLFSGPVLFADLDTVVVGDLSGLASYRGTFAILTDFYRPERGQSAVMMWTPGPHTEAIYRRFLEDPADPMYRLHSDQSFIDLCLPNADRIQDRYPGQCVSYKVHCRGRGVPDGARLVCAHGRPKPWDAEWSL